jgi:hypothetical protein
MTKPVPLWLAACCAVSGVALAGAASAQEMLPPPMVAMPDEVASADDEPPPVPPYRLHAKVFGGERELWAGYLAMTNYGYAEVRSFVTDMDATCPLPNDRFVARRHMIDLAIRPGQRENPYLYEVEATWTAPVEACADEGMRATGVRVEVELAEKQARVIEGERGLRVELTRLP